jgi:hypothetical protein
MYDNHTQGVKVGGSDGDYFFLHIEFGVQQMGFQYIPVRHRGRRCGVDDFYVSGAQANAAG